MTVFTTQEINLICIYDPGNRKGTIKELKNMMRYHMPDETDLHDLADGVIHKLKDMSDEEYDELSDSLTPDCSFDSEASAYGGNGLVISGRQYSAWYEETGIRIAYGKYARNVRMSQLLTWEDAAKRIGELMESGQYLSMLELASAPIHERKRLAESLWYMSRDMASEAEDYMPSLKALRGGGYPEETARLANTLADQDFVSLLAEEAKTFTDAYRQNHDLMRFRFYSPEFMLPALNELAMPRRDYDSLLTEVAKVQTFITEDEIDATISGGSSVAGGKGRIYQYFTAFPPHSAKERADFLKNEYGIGGRSHAVSGSDHSGENHDSKGIQLQKADGNRTSAPGKVIIFANPLHIDENYGRFIP